MTTSATSARVKPRQRLLATARRLFYRDGIHAVSLDRLCEEARVSKRSLYQYFANKDVLVTEMLASLGEPLLAAYLPADDDRPPRERILAVFDQLQQLAESAEFCGCPFANTALELKDRTHPAARVATQYKLALTAFFERQATLAGARAPAVVATQLTMLFDGACTHAVMQGGIPAAARGAAEALLTASGAR
jgi:AcrR family transcriptional regulator